MIPTALTAGTTSIATSDSGDGSFAPPTTDIFWLPVIDFGSWAITEQMVWGGISVIILSVLMVSLSKNAAVVPSKGQWLMERFYDIPRNEIARDMIGTKEFLRFVPLIVTLFSLILLNNWFGILPPVMNPVTGKIGFPIAFTLVVYVVYHWIGFSKHGFVGYFQHMIPAGLPGWIKPIIMVLELITYFITRPLTLALRLFGNMFAGHMLIVLFVSAGAYFLTQDVLFKFLSVPAFMMGAIMWVFEALVQFLQAYVFALLSASYIAGALADDH